MRHTCTISNESAGTGHMQHERFAPHSRRPTPGSRRGPTLGRHLRGLLALIVVSLSSASLCDAQVIWNIWLSVSEGKSTPGATVTTVPRGDRFALFLSDPGGSEVQWVISRFTVGRHCVKNATFSPTHP